MANDPSETKLREADQALTQTRIVEVLDTVDIGDDDPLLFGDDDDVDVRYESATDRLYTTASGATTVDFSPDVVLESTGQFADGNASAPAVTFSAATDMGLYRAGADMGLAVDGSQQVLVQSSAVSLTGNVLTQVGGTTDANSGALRLPNAEEVAWRNSAGDGDVAIQVDGNDNVVLGSTGSPDLNLSGGVLTQVGGTSDAASGAVRLANAGEIAWQNSGGTGDIALTVNSNDNVVIGSSGSPNLDLSGGVLTAVGGTADAGSGALRLPNAGEIAWRNSAGDGDVGLTVDGNDNVVLGSTGSPNLDLSGSRIVQVGGTPDAGVGDVRLASGGQIAWRNSANTDDHRAFWTTTDNYVLQHNTSDVWAVLPGSNEVRNKGNNLTQVGGESDAGSGAIRLANNTAINWRGSGGNNDYGITLDSNDDLQFTCDNLVDTSGNSIYRMDRSHVPVARQQARRRISV